jgi:hypothetical protein
MKRVIEQSNWTDFLKRYSEENEGKPTRLGVFEPNNGSSIDYWIEDGLPLLGLDTYNEKGKRRIEILFENYTHAIDHAAELVCVESTEDDRGLNISDSNGRTTQLRFENWGPQNGEDHHV